MLGLANRLSVVDLVPATVTLADCREWLIGQRMPDTFHLLPWKEQDTLVLARYLACTVRSVGGSNFSGPGLMVASVLEREIGRRIFVRRDHVGPRPLPELGRLPYLRKRGRTNYEEGERPARTRERELWGSIVLDMADRWDFGVAEFEGFVRDLRSVVSLRNLAAHHPLREHPYDDLVDRVWGGNRPGLLNVLLRALPVALGEIDPPAEPQWPEG